MGYRELVTVLALVILTFSMILQEYHFYKIHEIEYLLAKQVSCLVLKSGDSGE